MDSVLNPLFSSAVFSCGESRKEQHKQQKEEDEHRKHLGHEPYIREIRHQQASSSST
jgi:hypothetical protein